MPSQVSNINKIKNDVSNNGSANCVGATTAIFVLFRSNIYFLLVNSSNKCIIHPIANIHAAIRPTSKISVRFHSDLTFSSAFVVLVFDGAFNT